MPKVSVVIPTFNNCVQLMDSIRSVAGQTLSDIEILVVDDCSTDRTKRLVQSSSDARVKYLSTSANTGGPATPMTVGMQQATSPFIAFLDHDDLARPDWLEVLHSVMQENPSVGMAWGQHAVFSFPGTIDSVAFRNPFGDQPPKKLPIMLSWTPGTTGLLVRRDVFEEIGVFDSQAGSLADLDFTFRFAAHSRFEVACVDQILLDYRVHGGNLSLGVTPQRLSDFERFVEKHAEVLAAHPITHGKHLYTLAWTSYQLGKLAQTKKYIRRARSIDAANKKYQTFEYLLNLGLLPLVKPVSDFRALMASKLRLLKSHLRQKQQ